MKSDNICRYYLAMVKYINIIKFHFKKEKGPTVFRIKKVFLFLYFGLSLLCTGCSKKTKETEIIMEKLDQIFSASSQPELITENSLGAHIEELIFENTSYAVIEVANDSYTITIQSPNVVLLFDELYDEKQYVDLSADEYATATEQLLNNIEKKLEDNQFEVKETTLILPLEDGEIVVTEELINAFYGGLLDKARELTSNYLRNGN